MKKITLISIALATVLLVGCGGDSDSSTASENDAPNTTNTETDNINSVNAHNIQGYKISTIALSNGISTSVEFKCDGSFQNNIILNGKVVSTVQGDDIEVTNWGIEGKAIGVTRIIEFTGISSKDNEDSKSHITLNTSDNIVVKESNYGSSNMTIDKIEQVSTCN